MVYEEIVLGYKVFTHGIEVDKAKIEVIEQLPPPTNVKGIRSFLGHAGFYRHFIKNFSQIARPLTKLLDKDAPFVFNNEYHETFQILKKALILAPIIHHMIGSCLSKSCAMLATLLWGTFWAKQRIKSIMVYPMLAKPCLEHS